MHDFREFLQELSSNTNIEFRVTAEDGTVMFSSTDFVESSNIMYLPLYLGKIRAAINIDKKFELCTSLLKYTIENKYKELYSIKEQSLIDILEGKDVPEDKFSKHIPFLSKGCVAILINVSGSTYEALNVIKQMYNDQDVISIIYGDSILLVGIFEDVKEHAISIKEAITSNLYSKCYISFSNLVHDTNELKKAYFDCVECMMLGKRFGLKDEILDYNKLLFEKVVYHIDSELKQELLNNFKERFSIFDNEMISTIEEFVKCGLNISEAARRLYIHRNTLIYRLDKIYKETGFDIRNFKDATVFIIAFLVWKENK